MRTFAALPPGERALFFRQYQQFHGVDPVIVEKDFWGCWLLGRVFAQPALGRTAVFKGGTSLAKVFSAISRFSEDVDLGISPASLGWPEERLENATRNAWNERIRPELEAACAQHVSSHWLPNLESDLLTQLGASPSGRAWLTYKLDAVSHSPILFFAYPGALPRGIDYIAREVKMEFGSLADQRPAGTRSPPWSPRWPRPHSPISALRSWRWRSSARFGRRPQFSTPSFTVRLTRRSKIATPDIMPISRLCGVILPPAVRGISSISWSGSVITSRASSLRLGPTMRRQFLARFASSRPTTGCRNCVPTTPRCGRCFSTSRSRSMKFSLRCTRRKRCLTLRDFQPGARVILAMTMSLTTRWWARGPQLRPHLRSPAPVFPAKPAFRLKAGLCQSWRTTGLGAPIQIHDLQQIKLLYCYLWHNKCSIRRFHRLATILNKVNPPIPRSRD
ncbi:MAG: nucleotidyl transferase AbiEii/AbiGii toxin family protein [Verrucomicrobia bacterium]|nr:nucleotidyl transferase AbiEii/AbiGii toxin family protein [Verrucomicrobiota bacterium]